MKRLFLFCGVMCLIGLLPLQAQTYYESEYPIAVAAGHYLLKFIPKVYAQHQ